WAGTSWLYRRRPETSRLVVEIVFGEKHLRCFREARPSILEIGGHVHAVKKSRTATQYGIRGKLIGETEARSPVVPIHRGIATVGSCRDGRAPNLADLSKLGERSCLIAVHRNADSRVSSEIAELEPVESLGVRSAPLVAQSEIQSKLRRSLPVV